MVHISARPQGVSACSIPREVRRERPVARRIEPVDTMMGRPERPTERSPRIEPAYGFGCQRLFPTRDSRNMLESKKSIYNSVSRARQYLDLSL